MKATPKSCSCSTCTYCKASKGGQFQMRAEERQFRHLANQAVRTGKTDDVLPAGTRNRVG